MAKPPDEYYPDKIREFGINDSRTVSWRTREIQDGKIGRLLSPVIKGSSVLDVGGGIGRLKELRPDVYPYLNIELVPEFIKECWNRHGDDSARFGDFLSITPLDKHDWVVMCAPLMYGFATKIKDDFGEKISGGEYIKRMIEKAWEKCNIGVAAECLSKTSGEYTTIDPCEFLRIALNITKYCTIVTESINIEGCEPESYLYMFREPEDMRSWIFKEGAYVKI